MERELQGKRKDLIQFIATLGGFLGVIVAVNPPQSDPIRSTFVTFLALFMVCSLICYSYILFDVNPASSFYKTTAFFLSLSFSVLLTTAVSGPVATAIIKLKFSGDATIVAYLALVIVFGLVLYILVARLLTMDEAGINRLRNRYR